MDTCFTFHLCLDILYFTNSWMLVFFISCVYWNLILSHMCIVTCFIFQICVDILFHNYMDTYVICMDTCFRFHLCMDIFLKFHMCMYVLYFKNAWMLSFDLICVWELDLISYVYGYLFYICMCMDTCFSVCLL